MTTSARCPGGVVLGDKYLVCGRPAHQGSGPCRATFSMTAHTGQHVFIETQWGSAELLPWVSGAAGIPTEGTSNAARV